MHIIAGELVVRKVVIKFNSQFCTAFLITEFSIHFKNITVFRSDANLKFQMSV